MEWLASQDPIIACSSGTSENTAISVIRLSGIGNLKSVQDLFSLDLSKVTPRKAFLSKIHFNEKVLDEVLLTYFEGPNSYNGENILELSVHGNPVNIRRIIEAFKSINIREANPGEITYRALRNNKLTMTQVEGLDTLLNATSVDIYDQGLSNLNGSLQKEYLKLKDLYLTLRGSIEILIDFSEDVGEEESLGNFHNSYNEFMSYVFKLKKRTETPRSHLLKPKVVFLGNTNAGKSTLFNELIQERRAIVSDIKGTTRDYITEFFLHSGVEFQVVDTAGIRESEDLIEIEGIKLSKKLYSEAFFKLLVINPFLDDDICAKEFAPDAVIFTHADSEGFKEKLSNYRVLDGSYPLFYSGSIGATCAFGSIGPGLSFAPIGPTNISGSIGPVSKTAPIGPKNNNGPIEPVQSIAPIGPGISGGPIEPLKQLKDLVLYNYRVLVAVNPILPSRQRSKISELSIKVDEITPLITEVSDPAILSSEINILAPLVDDLLGITTPEDVLNNIFSNFCIGK